MLPNSGNASAKYPKKQLLDYHQNDGATSTGAASTALNSSV